MQISHIAHYIQFLALKCEISVLRNSEFLRWKFQSSDSLNYKHDYNFNFKSAFNFLTLDQNVRSVKGNFPKYMLRIIISDEKPVWVWYKQRNNERKIH